MELNKTRAVHCCTYAKCWLLLLALLFPLNVWSADLRSNIDSWKTAFDVVPEDNAYATRVQNIFERLKSIVGSKVLLSELYILDSDNQPWAIALEDGNVVLSRGSLDVVYGSSSTSMEAKDAQMAFILGHELNHIAKQDFWHEQVYRGFVSRSVVNTDQKSIDTLSRRRETELRADEDGFIYASLAGFNTRTLVTALDSKEDFLHYWVQQTRTAGSKSNFNVELRAQFLAQTLLSLDEAVKYFEYGTRLAHFGFYDEAKLLLDEFFRIYPSHQVLNNLGFVHLQLARREMPLSLSKRFWFPDSLDLNSGIPKTSRSLTQSVPDRAEKSLQTSIRFLEEAVKLAWYQDTNAVANLAVAHLYLSNFTKARSVLETALEKDAENEKLQTLLAISVLEDPKLSKDWQASIRRDLVKKAISPDAPIDLVYNAVRLLGKANINADTFELLHKLDNRFAELPPVYRTQICSTYPDTEMCRREPYAYTDQSQPWLPFNGTGILPGSSIDEPVIQKFLGGWLKPVEINLAGISAIIFEHPNGNSILAIDRIVTLVTQKRHNFDFKQHLVQVNDDNDAAPLTEISFGADTLLSNGTQWAARSPGETISELWFADKLYND